MDKNKIITDLTTICRFCLKHVDSEKVEIDEVLRKQFNNITNIELVSNDSVNYSCRRCYCEIRKFSVVKAKLLKNQKRLAKMIEKMQNFVPDTVDQDESIKNEYKDSDCVKGLNIKEEELSGVGINYEPNFSVNCENPADQIPNIDGSNPEQIAMLSKRKRVVASHELEISEIGDIKAKKLKKIETGLHLQAKDRVMCEDCGNYFTKSSLKNHRLRKHSKELPKYECDVCGRKFFRKGELKDHMTVHTGIKELSCHLCFKMYGTRNALNMHINKFHYKKWQVYCEYCGKLFTNRGNYAGHIRSNHTGEKPFQCEHDECGKSFYNNGDLKKHLLHVHSNEEQTCEICLKVFRSIISLRRHKKIHVAVRERKFECSFENCDKKFMTNALLQQHQKVHVGQKDYRCIQCGMEYFKNAELKRHIRSIHMRIKLKCEITGCKSQFARKETYRNHVISHHKKDIGEYNVKVLLEKIRDFQLPEPQLEVGFYVE